MAKKKAETPRVPKTRGRPKSDSPKQPTPIVMTIRARADWETWFDGLCEALKKSSGLGIKIERTDAIDVALRNLAEKLGLPEPPPRY